MAQARGIKPVGYFDCAGGGQVVVSGTTAYVAHMKAPHGTTVVDVSDPANPRRLAEVTIPPDVHSHKVRVVNDVMLVNREAAPRTTPGAGFRGGLGVFVVSRPDRPRGRGRKLQPPPVAEAARGFTDAGATVHETKIGIKHSQRELSDVWNRLIMPLNIAGLEGLKAGGLDLMRDHPEDLPPEYRRWIEIGYGLSAMDVWADQAIRTEIYDAIEAVLQNHDLLVTPTLACMPVKNASDGNTLGPAQINGEEVDPAIGWCLTYFTNFSGHPSASIPAGLVDGLPVGMQIIGRRGADVDVLAASAAFERVRPWTDAYRLCENRTI